MLNIAPHLGDFYRSVAIRITLEQYPRFRRSPGMVGNSTNRTATSQGASGRDEHHCGDCEVRSTMILGADVRGNVVP